jgi:hypothetical protein
MSTKSQVSYFQYMKKKHPRWSRTRWFGELAAIVGLLNDDPTNIDNELLSNIIQWLCNCDDLGDGADSSFATLRELVDPSRWLTEERRVQGRRFLYQLRCEIVILREICTPFKRACYHLEGDYCAGFLAYDEIDHINNWLEANQQEAENIGRIPEVIALKHENDAEIAEVVVNIARTAMQAANDYFVSHFYGNADISRCVNIYRSLRIANPIHANGLLIERQLNVAYVLPILKDLVAEHLVVGEDEEEDPSKYLFPTKRALLKELPQYIAAVREEKHSHRKFVAKIHLITQFWSKNRQSLPNWAKLADIVALVQPSSAAAERAFSHLKQILNYESMLVDAMEAALMARCNGSRVFKRFVAEDSDSESEDDNDDNDVIDVPSESEGEMVEVHQLDLDNNSDSDSHSDNE